MEQDSSPAYFGSQDAKISGFENQFKKEKDYAESAEEDPDGLKLNRKPLENKTSKLSQQQHAARSSRP